METMARDPPPPLRVLISGAGIAGPALALHLSRLPPPLRCATTIVEKNPRLRVAGQQVDLRGQGIDAMRRLGPAVEAAIRRVVVQEPGMRMLDARGRTVARFGSNKSGKGMQTFSAEWEIMRGDLCEVLYAATEGLDGVRYEFGKTVETVSQPEEGRRPGGGDGRRGPVRVRFSDGEEAEFDLVVGADGVGSRIRKAMFTDGRPDQLMPIGMTCALYTIPPQEGDGADATWCHLPGRRFIMTRRDRPDCLRVALGYGGESAALRRALKHGTVAEQKAAWAGIFRHDMHEVWQMPRYLAGLDSPQADDFFTQEYAQVKLDSWSRGRLTLLGDAGYCPSPLTGMGTSLALAGAYVLAGEIARVCGRAALEEGEVSPWDRIPEALVAYEKTLRPFVEDVQGIPVRRIARIFVPNSAWAITCFQWLFWLLALLRVDRLAAMLSSDNRGRWEVPNYPELLPPKA